MVYHPHQPSTYGKQLVFFTMSPCDQTPRTPRSFNGRFVKAGRVSFPPGQAKTLLPALRLEPGRLCREGRPMAADGGPGGWPGGLWFSKTTRPGEHTKSY